MSDISFFTGVNFNSSTAINHWWITRQINSLTFPFASTVTVVNTVNLPNGKKEWRYNQDNSKSHWFIIALKVTSKAIFILILTVTVIPMTTIVITRLVTRRNVTFTLGPKPGHPPQSNPPESNPPQNNDSRQPEFPLPSTMKNIAPANSDQKPTSTQCEDTIKAWYAHDPYDYKKDFLFNYIKNSSSDFLSNASYIINEILLTGNGCEETNRCHTANRVFNELVGLGGALTEKTCYMLSIAQGWIPDKNFYEYLKNLPALEQGNFYKIAWCYNNPYLIEPAQTAIRGDQYSLNFLWINKNDAQRTYIKSGTENDVCKDIIEPILGWAKENPDSTINLWYDSKTTDETSIENTRQLFIRKDKALSQKILLKDIQKKLSPNENDMIDKKSNFWMKIDWFRAKMIEFSLQDPAAPQYCVYSDLDAIPMNSSQFLGKQSLAILDQFGFGVAIGTGVGAPYENGFQIFNKSHTLCQKLYPSVLNSLKRCAPHTDLMLAFLNNLFRHLVYENQHKKPMPYTLSKEEEEVLFTNSKLLRYLMRERWIKNADFPPTLPIYLPPSTNTISDDTSKDIQKRYDNALKQLTRDNLAK